VQIGVETLCHNFILLFLEQIPKSHLDNNLDCVKWVGETKIQNRLEDSAPIWKRF
jgi:hypothetical protein